MPRKPKGERALTPAERNAAHRARLTARAKAQAEALRWIATTARTITEARQMASAAMQERT